MTSDPLFFAYDPRPLRAGLFAGAVASVAMAAWALASALDQGVLLQWARLGVALGLVGAFGYVLFRVRPREGWGVKVDRLGLTISRPLSGEKLELVWSQLSEVKRQERGGEKLVLLVQPEGRLLLPRHLFPNNDVYRALARALEDRLPPARYDA